jgi:hypothetical protein
MAKPKKSLAKQVAEVLPGVGTAMDVAEVGKSLAAGQYGKAAVDAGIALAGVTPIGRGVTRLGKFAYDVFRKTDDKDIALKLIKDQDARANWLKGKQKELGIDPTDPDYGEMDLVPKAEIKRRQTRKFAEQVEQLERDEITGTEYRRFIRENQPATTFDKEDLDTMVPTFEDLVGGLDVKNANKASSGVIGLDSTIEKGAEVTARLDIPAYNNRDIWVATLKKTKGTAEDKKSKYGRTAVLKDVEFSIEGKTLEKQSKNIRNIAKGYSEETGKKVQKSPLATMKGKWQDVSDEDAFEMAKKAMDDPSYIQVGFNPERHSFFYDKATMLPVFEATNIIQIGPLVLAKVPGVVNSALAARTLPKAERVKRIGKLRDLRIDTSGEGKFPGRGRTFNKGGVVPMQEQMKFAFMNEGGVLADDGVERDPVSGNEVPAGSMAEEVRDDVPAMLSEGEYVVPADVVRYHGIDKFEELRDEAKMGLARMEADGRIGGQPVEEQEEFPFPVEELEGFQEGGAVGDTYSDVTGSDFKANQPYGAGGGRFPGVGFELRNFTNPKTGRTVVIPFFNGQSMQYIPPDFLEGGATTTRGGTFDPAADERSRQEDEAERARQGGQTGLTPLAQEVVNKVIAGESTGQQGKSFDQYTSEDWNRYIKNADSKTADVTSKLPIIGNLQRMSEKAARSFAKTALRSGKNPATEKPLSTDEKLTLERVLMVAPNTSMTESIINAVTGRGETIQGLPLTEQAGFEFGKPVREGDVMVKPVTKLPDDLLPDMSRFKEQDTTKPQDQPQTQDVSNLYGRGFTPEQIGEAPVQVQDGTAKQPSTGFNLDSALFSAAEASMPKGQNIPFTQTKMKGYNEIKASGTKQDYENLLQRIVVAEAGSEDLIGQALVARAILNRKGVLDDNFSPSTFYTNSSDLVDIIYGGTAESGVDKLLGGNVQKAIQQGKGYQFEPVGKGIITDPNRFNTANMTEAASAIALAQNPTKLKQELRKKGYKPEQIKNLMASTGFANLATQEARGVKDDKTQDVNRVKYGRHTFNTAGNKTKKVYNPNPYEGTTDQGAPTFAGVPLMSPLETGQAVAQQQPGFQNVIDRPQQGFQNIIDRPQQGFQNIIDRPQQGFQNVIEPQPTQQFIQTATQPDLSKFEPIEGATSGSFRDLMSSPQFTGQDFPTQLGEQQSGFGQLPTPVVKREYELPGSLSEQEVMRRPTTFTGPTGAGIGPMSEDEKIKLDLGKSYTDPYGAVSFRDKRNFIDANLQPSISAPAIDQTAAMLGTTGKSGKLPQVGGTAGSPAFQNIIAPTRGVPDFVTQIGGATSAPTPQKDFVFDYGFGTTGSPTTTAQADDQPDTPELRDLKQRAQTRAAAKKSRQMNQARQDVIMGGGSAFEADAAAQAVFLDQSDEIRRNQELNKGKTLTQVLQEEERREEESSGGGGGFGGGDTGGSDKSIVCTEIYRQTQLSDWSKAMRVWDTYQRRYLTPEHEIGYHWLFRPYVSGMKKSNLLTRFGALMAGRRTQHLKHVLTKGKAKDDLFGNVFCKIIHPTVYMAGKIKNFLDGKTKAT